MSTSLWENSTKQIFISTIDQSADTNRTKMEHLLLSITIGFKDLVIGSARLGYNIIVYSNQSSASIDVRRHSDQDIPFGSRKIGNDISVDFGQNENDKSVSNQIRYKRLFHQVIHK